MADVRESLDLVFQNRSSLASRVFSFLPPQSSLGLVYPLFHRLMPFFKISLDGLLQKIDKYPRQNGEIDDLNEQSNEGMLVDKVGA